MAPAPGEPDGCLWRGRTGNVSRKTDKDWRAVRQRGIGVAVPVPWRSRLDFRLGPPRGDDGPSPFPATPRRPVPRGTSAQRAKWNAASARGARPRATAPGEARMRGLAGSGTRWTCAAPILDRPTGPAAAHLGAPLRHKTSPVNTACPRGSRITPRPRSGQSQRSLRRTVLA